MLHVLRGFRGAYVTLPYTYTWARTGDVAPRLVVDDGGDVGASVVVLSQADARW